MKASLSLLSLLLFAACRTGTPQSPELTLQLPQAWSSAHDPAEISAASFWESFGDEHLSRAVEEALALNPSLREASARVLAAAAEARIAGAASAPDLKLDGNAARQKQIFVGLPIPGGNVLQSTTTAYGVSLELAWEPDLWGRLSAGARAASQSLRASLADEAAAKLSLAGQTAKAWFAWTEAGLQRELAAANATSWAQTEQSVERRLAAGQASALERRLVSASLASARAQVAARAEAEERAARQLELLMGRIPQGSLDQGSRLPELGPLPPASVPGRWIARRPDLAASEARLCALHERLTQSRAALYPSLRLQAAVGRTSDEAGDLIDPNFSVWSIAAALAQPLFQGGKLRAGVDLADARVKEGLASFEATLLNALGEVEMALASEAALAHLYELSTLAQAQALAAEELARERYPLGQASLLEVFEAERRALESKVQVLSIQQRRLSQRVDLLLALGGGFGTSDQP